jgi:hypothetical protein
MMNDMRIEWRENEEPIRYWKFMNYLRISLILIVVLIVIVDIFIFNERRLLVIGVWLGLIILLSIIFFLHYRRTHNIWPKRVGFSVNEIHFEFLKKPRKNIRWDKIKEIKMLNPSSSILMQAEITYKDGKRENNIDTGGRLAIELESRFDEYKKQLQKSVNIE